MSDPQRPHGLQPTRLLRPWDFSRQEYWSGVPLPSLGCFKLLSLYIEDVCNIFKLIVLILSGQSYSKMRENILFSEVYVFNHLRAYFTVDIYYILN